MTRAKQSLTFFIPNSVPEQNSWLSRIHFFKEFSKINGNKTLLEEQYEKDKLILWRLNEGDYKTDTYCFRVQSSDSICKLEKASCEVVENTDLLSKTEDQNQKELVVTGGENYFETASVLKIKSSKDFVESKTEQESFSEEQKNSLKQKEESDKNQKKEVKDLFYLTKTKNFLFKRNLGDHLHFFLQKLSYQSFEEIQTLIENSFLTNKDKEQIRQALIYITQLKKPEMNLFLKEGFSEWPFKLQKQNVIFQGQIDLWANHSDEIHLFDYKSSSPQSSTGVKKQLIFYSWILDESYHPKKIWMYEVYPFQKDIKQSLYDKAHKNLIEAWIKQINLNKSINQ